jgi:signal transduction histidine kinase
VAALSLKSWAQNGKIVLNTDTKSIVVNDSPYITDNALSLTVSDLNSNATAKKFSAANGQPVALTDRSCYWLKLQVQNGDAKPGEWVLAFDSWQYVDFYRLDTAKTPEKKITGRLVPFLNRDVPLANHCFIRLALKANEVANCYIRLRSNAGRDEVKAGDLSFTIYNAADVQRRENSKLNLIYFFCGIYLVMFLYNLFIYFSTREKGYIYYLGMLLFLILAILSNSGYIIQILKGISSFPTWYPLADLVCSTILGTLIILFAKEFLKLRQNSPRLNKAFNVMIGCLFLMFIPALWGNLLLANNVSSVLGLITVVLILSASIQSYRERHHSALLFLIAYGVFVVGLAFFLLGQMGIVPANTITQFSLEIGSSAEAVIFSFALADRINVLKKQNDENQARIIEQLNEYNKLQLKLNHELEEKVEQRTHELRLSQMQLLQKEKLVALGELTAGIAHEIQNPLNFVNNFSEVNADLLAELEQEAGKGNFKEVKTLIADMKDNTEKVVYHGKRADGIVKAMLLHSGAGSGKKETVNLNQLVDEHLKLTYNGFRAKDKTFQATLKIDSAEQDIEAEVVKQELGRALMNIFNNAFFAVNEKSKLNENGYDPLVSITVQKNANEARIVIKDNGNGIKQHVLSKIFQPFFTTKPTGEGTGLGLSLSYDTVKAHGGEITVDTLEGEFAEFTISLPL